MNGCPIKDLRVVSSDLSRIVILDNSVVSFALQMSNGIYIKPFNGATYDDELFKIREVLIELAKEVDVRVFIEKRFEIQKLFDVYSGK